MLLITVIHNYLEKLFKEANWKLFLLILILFTVIGLLIAMFLQFSKDAYYFTLSSIFQGLFSILALAGIFLIFRIEQLSKDEAKYETDFKDHLMKIKNQTMPDLSSIGFMGGISSKDIMEWNEHDAILKLLDERKFREYSEELNKLEYKFVEEDTKFEEELSKLTREIEEEVEKGEGFPHLGLSTSRIDMTNIEEFRKQKTDALKICNNHVKECKKKGVLIKYNRSLKGKILNDFKYPFILGMILIVFTIFFLPMLTSNAGFWFEFPFQIPSNLIIGTLVSLTIMVILTIMLVIYYSMWSDEAKRTLI